MQNLLGAQTLVHLNQNGCLNFFNPKIGLGNYLYFYAPNFHIYLEEFEIKEVKEWI